MVLWIKYYSKRNIDFKIFRKKKKYNEEKSLVILLTVDDHYHFIKFVSLVFLGFNE